MYIIESQGFTSPAAGRSLPPSPPSEELGGKAANLLQLGASGLPVPPWICLPASFIAGLLDRLPRALVDRLRSLPNPPGTRPASDIEELGKALREAVAAVDFSARERRGILHAFDQAFGADALVAVRSSAVGEDGRERSFAGQLDSFLFVSRDQLLVRIKDCCASAFSDRALAYRARHALGTDVRLAVIIQRMVESQVSGILFTANPMTHDRDELVLVAGYGVGEGVVSNGVDSDTYYVSRRSRAVRCELADKPTRVVRNAASGAGTTVAPVPEEQARQAALRNDQVDALVALGLRIEEVFGCPQDVEWAIDAAGAYHITQARPITTLDASAPEAQGGAGAHRIFDNSNIVEGYPGVTTPLTFSFARHAYAIAFRELARAFGVSDEVLREEQATLDTMLGFLHGRIYYHLPSWYRFYSFVPGFQRNMDAWENAMGVRDPALFRRQQESVRSASDRWLLAQARVAARGLWNFANLPGSIRRFDERFRQVGERHVQRMARARSVDDLLALYDELIADLLHHWAPALVNDVYAFNFYHLLQTLLGRSGLEDADTLCAELLCGISGMESVEPVYSLLRLVAQIRSTPALSALLEGVSDDREVWNALQRDPAFAAFRQAAERHIQRFGDRTVEELKLETPGLAETPEYLIGLCRAYLATGRDLHAQEAREAGIRAAAERKLRQGLRHRPWRLALLWLVLQQTRATVKNRENTRLARTRMVGMVKRIFRAVGERYARAGTLDAADDIYFLTIDEIQSYARGTCVSGSLRDLVRMRRAEHDRHLRMEPANRIEIHGVVHAALARAPAPVAGDAPVDDVVEEAVDGAVLVGQGCAPGKVRARCRVLRSPRSETSIAGEVLVAPSTDPGWVFLMMAASGLVVERGNLLSHTAIIGRELGIPTVIGVKGATRRIPAGARVEVDGGRGTVVVLPKAETEAETEAETKAETKAEARR